jgi:hydroxymethylbilane synthase
MFQNKIIRIGTRGSMLALAQTDMVIDSLKAAYPDMNIEKVVLHTQGDKILDKPLVDFGGKGVFVSEFEEALLGGDIDLAVHSSKDMPMELAEGLDIAGVLPRGDVRDVLVTKKQLGNVEAGVIGTGSLRRQLQLKKLYPEISCISIRGNVPTRLQKVRDNICDGVILAAAGLERLNLQHEPDFDYYYFTPEQMIPAGGQGIITVEGRAEDDISRLVNEISDNRTMVELETERYILKLLNAGCHEAIGVHASANEKDISICLMYEKNGQVYNLKKQGNIQDRIKLAESMVSQIL